MLWCLELLPEICVDAQVVILVVDQGQRPDLPQDLSQLPGRPLRHVSTYLDLIHRCWHQDPTHRPTFERIITQLRCALGSGVAASARSERQGAQINGRNVISSWGSG